MSKKINCPTCKDNGHIPIQGIDLDTGLTQIVAFQCPKCQAWKEIVDEYSNYLNKNTFIQK